MAYFGMMKNKVTLTKDNCKILICCHKPCELPQNEDVFFLPIQVGAATSNVDLGMQRDDLLNGKSCANISAKNKSYCELTALYWAWKNIKKKYPDLEYIGLNHYRRYFCFDKRDNLKTEIEKNANDIELYNLDKVKLQKKLEKNDCVIPSQLILPYSVEVHYCLEHMSQDFRTVKAIIASDYPDYLKDFEEIACNGNKISFFNMFIMKYGDFENYCQWIFSILAKAESLIDIHSYDSVQMRVFGYLAERLFNVYVYHNFSKKCYLNVYKYVDSFSKMNRFYLFLGKTRNFLGYNLFFKRNGIVKL